MAIQKEWFVLHTLTGQEYKVRDSISVRRKHEEMEDLIGEVVIPTEKVAEVKRGVKTTSVRKFFPGYVLINLSLYDEPRRINERSWYFIKETPGVIGFLGGDNPVPLPQSEVDIILCQEEDRREQIKPRVTFEPGESVRIIDGPFVNFLGGVESVDPERGKLKVSVDIFGRRTVVELEYWQVERAE